MNCQDALQLLEAARPSSDDLRDPELAPAANHLDACPRCREVYASRESLDRRIGRVMRDVPVPVGLRERLLESLGEKAVPQSAPAASKAKDVSQRAASSRRRWLHAMVGVSIAAAALVSGVVLLLTGDPPADTRLTMETLRNETKLNVRSLPAFDGDFAPRPPGGLWKHRDIVIDETARGDLRGKNGKHRVAVYEFAVHDRNNRPHRGVILAIPTSALQDPPAATTVNTRRNDVYASRPGGNWHMLSWQSKEEGLTYVCFMRTGGDALDALERALTPPAA